MKLLISDFPKKRKEAIHNRQLKKLVAYAKQNSPFFSEYYKNLPSDFSLSDLPVIDKKTIMKNYDAYSTDRAVTLNGVKEYMTDKNNAYGNRFYLDKYALLPTSGSTGEPMLILGDSAYMLNISVGAFITHI